MWTRSIIYTLFLGLSTVQFGADADAQLTRVLFQGGCIGLDMFDIESEPGAMRVQILTRCGISNQFFFQTREPRITYRYDASKGAYLTDPFLLIDIIYAHNEYCGSTFRLQESDLTSLRLGYDSYWINVEGKPLQTFRGTWGCDRQ
ncbi:hypothetical protein FOZ60_014153 [Perkinsus olseni]|uniref:Uncharacterized protein n=1 Tax=Perkinsus olseni TaxID=32597 RepID=A0A7J6N809_PEROL|nr:hypothetical protein FOZ60_014153 [Perkinsus olseni]